MKTVGKPQGNPSIARGTTPKGRPTLRTGNKVGKRYNGTTKRSGCKKCKGG